MKEFIVAVREQNPLGTIVSAYFAEETNQNFYTLTEPIHLEDIEGFDYPFSETEMKIIKLTDSYSKKNLTKIFAKGIKSHDYIKSLTENEISTKIRPFIEERITKIIKTLIQSEIKLFHKADSYNVVHKEDIITIHKNPAKTVFNINKENNGTKYFLSAKHNENEINLTENSGIILTNEPCILVLNNDLYTFDDIDGKKLLPFFEKQHIFIPAQTEKKWFEAFAVNAIKKYEVKASGFNIIDKITDKKAVITLEKDWNYEYVLVLSFEYGNISFAGTNNEKNKLEFNIDKFEFTKYSRDFNWEYSFEKTLLKAGLTKHLKNIYKADTTKSDSEKQRKNTINWLNLNSEIFKNHNIEFRQAVDDKKFFTEKISLKFQITENKDWFDLQGVAIFGKFEIPFITLKNNILNKNPEFVLPDGTIAIIPDEWFAKYSEIMTFGKEKNDTIEIKKYHFPLIDSEKIETIDKSIFERVNNLSETNISEINIPDEIRAVLRPYQAEGYKHLYKLQKSNFGACLADDMGLGKTLQTITLLQKTINTYKENQTEKIKSVNTAQLDIFSQTTNNFQAAYKRKASIIIMPVSLIHNWENEIMKFSPFLKVLKYRGSKRDKKTAKFDKYDIILTGYGIVRNDIEILSQYEFLYVILDESQFVKNPDSKIYKAVSSLNSVHKLILTGTPIENSLSDLWSQMNFINKGMLGNHNFFKNYFITKIEKENNEQTKKTLKKIIEPFIIRRTKEQVAKDLPSLSEQTVYCEMSDTQKEIYESEKSKIRNLLLENLGKSAKNDSSLMVIQALTKLRQIANHPVLTQPDYDGNSGKFDDIIRDTENIISENHKVLIFSSFVKHLEIFENYFIEKKLKYSKLTGKTANRENVISEFQNDTENRIFLISIKAGGTGLNLTEADYVFIIDPWWNPAVEKQAVNRAHRIGQDKKVMVYKYISRNSVEEKIKILQDKKLELSDEFITSDNPFKDFSAESILELFD